MKYAKPHQQLCVKLSWIFYEPNNLFRIFKEITEIKILVSDGKQLN